MKKFISDTTKGILGYPDSDVLWSKIISDIPDSVLLRPNIKILSMASGHCTEASCIAKRMLALGIDRETVRESIWVNDTQIEYINFAKKGGFVNIIDGDITKWDSKGMKFDVVIGNPPFEKVINGKRSNGGANLWPEFIQLAFDTLVAPGGWVAMITPPGWVSPTSDIRHKDLYIYKNYLKHFNTVTINLFECGRYFDVSIDFSYFVTETVPSKGATVIITPYSTATYNLQNIEVLPTTINEATIGLLDLVFSYKGDRLIRETDPSAYSMRHNGKNLVAHSTSSHHVPVYINNKRGYEYSNTLGKSHTHPKIFFGYADAQFNPVVDVAGSFSVSENCATIYLDATDTHLGATSIINSELMKALANLLWWGKNQTGFVACMPLLPRFDMSTAWSDEDIYKAIGITGHKDEQLLRNTIKEHQYRTSRTKVVESLP